MARHPPFPNMYERQLGPCFDQKFQISLFNPASVISNASSSYFQSLAKVSAKKSFFCHNFNFNNNTMQFFSIDQDQQRDGGDARTSSSHPYDSFFFQNNALLPLNLDHSSKIVAPVPTYHDSEKQQLSLLPRTRTPTRQDQYCFSNAFEEGFENPFEEGFENPFQDSSLEPRPLLPNTVSPAPALDDDSCSLSSLLSSLQDLVGNAFEAIDTTTRPLSPAGEVLDMEWGFTQESKSTHGSNTTTKKRDIMEGYEFLSSNNQSKRQKKNTPQEPPKHDDADDSTALPNFRPHQHVLWQQRFQQLVAYKEENGHCCVPITYSDQLLARWVKRQRYQYNRYQDGKPSVINAERIEDLESIGFIWDAHSVLWEENWNELSAYVKSHGHCCIRTNDSANRQLATWAKCQRRQHKLLRNGKRSNMTEERVDKLNSLGFVWYLRQPNSCT